jgi:L-threonylcarbamoyladenylate synthase
MKLIGPDELQLAAEALARGDLVVMPTRRWYMVCADASNADTCERIFRAKKRPQAKSLAYVVPDREVAASKFAMSEGAYRLAREFWPGDLAMLLPWREEELGSAHPPVGVPNALVVHEAGVLGELARISSVPIGATTINISGPPNAPGPGPAITLAEVRRFSDEHDLAISYAVDDGICPTASHLTIVDCTLPEPQIIRPGIVHDRAVAAALATANDRS